MRYTYVQQKGAYLVKAMMDLHEKFDLSNKYVAAFRIFPGNMEEDEEIGEFKYNNLHDQLT